MKLDAAQVEVPGVAKRQDSRTGYDGLAGPALCDANAACREKSSVVGGRIVRGHIQGVLANWAELTGRALTLDPGQLCWNSNKHSDRVRRTSLHGTRLSTFRSPKGQRTFL